MGAENILGFKGGLVGDAGVMGLYYLANGLILFSETAQDTEDGWVSFDPHATLIIQPQQTRTGQVQLGTTKASESMFKPTDLSVPVTAIVMRVKTGDRDFVSRMRAALAGLVIPGSDTIQ